MEDKIRVLVPEQEVDEKIAELGRKISEDYAGRQVHLVCVLKGGVFFMCCLLYTSNTGQDPLGCHDRYV